MRHNAFPDGATRDGLIDTYRSARRRSRALFDMVAPDAYYDRPIRLRNPIVFYEGHLPAFSLNTLVKLALRRKGIDEGLEVLFARGIDPESEDSVRDDPGLWPSRGEIQAFAAECDELVERALCDGTLEDDSVPQLRGGEAVFTILEHELMHQETLLYLLHELPHEKKIAPVAPPAAFPAAPVARTPGAAVRIPRGTATLGATRDASFGWDNEFPEHTVTVEPFEIDVHDVTNAEFLEYVEATGAAAPHFWARDGREWRWRGMFAFSPLNPDAPAWVTQNEAASYARWKGKRLPTEAEFHRAAYGTPSNGERAHPWGDDPPDATRGNFDFLSLDPVAVGSCPAGASAWGVHDLVGNGWEWTGTLFDGFEGFSPMPSYPVYSADFFDGKHYVMKGASPATARELVRRSFRNWFRPAYPYMYATFRCVRATSPGA